MEARDELIRKAARIAELWFKPWGAAKGAELERLGIDCLNPERAVQRMGELLREAEETQAVSAAGHAVAK